MISSLRCHYIEMKFICVLVLSIVAAIPLRYVDNKIQAI